MSQITTAQALGRRRTPLQVLRRPEPRSISAAEEAALRCAARTEDTSRWTARVRKMLVRRHPGYALLAPEGRAMIASQASADALRLLRLSPGDAPPVLEALVALLFDGVRQRGVCRVAMKHIDSAAHRMTFEDCRGRTTDYRLSPATCQLLARLPYVSPEQPLLGLSVRSSEIAWRRICAMAELPGLSMGDVRLKARAADFAQ